MTTTEGREVTKDGAEGEISLARISRELVATMKREYGRGPVSAQSYLLDDFLIVVMRGGLTTAEKTMLDVGRPDAVREFRQIFENEMKETLVGLIEGLVGKPVVTYQSQVLFDPDIVIEIFFFAEPFGKDAIAQTIKALTSD